MEYAPLRAINPSDADLTTRSSAWLASRLMPGRGPEGICVPHFRAVNNAAMRTCENADCMAGALLAIGDGEAIKDVESMAGDLAWRGLWAVGNLAVIGRGHSVLGLVAPFSTFNMGYRYRMGWRPRRVG